jgi:glycosyltransferase involved in cell wall biosynthesis
MEAVSGGSTAKQLTVVIPAYNEEATVGRVVGDLRSVCGDVIHQIIVVDDGSKDGTGRAAEEAGARVIRHAENVGYGAAIKRGIRAAETEFVVTMDADGQHRAEDVLGLWAQAPTSDMVVGERRGVRHTPLWRVPGKWFLGRLANYLVRRKIPDLNSGLRLMRRELALRYLHICPSGFSFSTTMTMTLLSQGYTLSYIPIQVEKRIGRSRVSVGTGLQTIILILRIASLFNPLRVYIPASLAIGLAGVAWGIPYALAGRGVSVGSMLAIVTAIVLFALGLLCDQISQSRLERLS